MHFQSVFIINRDLWLLDHTPTQENCCSPLFIDYKANGRSLTFRWPIKYLSKEAPHTIVKSGIIAFACEMISKLHPDHLTVFRTPYQVLFFKRFRILFFKVLVLYYRFENIMFPKIFEGRNGISHDEGQECSPSRRRRRGIHSWPESSEIPFLPEKIFGNTILRISFNAYFFPST